MTILIKNGQRYSLRQLEKDLGGKSIPENPSLECLAQHGVYKVERAAPPAYDPMTQRVVESFSDASGMWQHMWTVEDLPAEEIARRDFDRALTPVQFQWLLAFTGLEDVWNAMLDATKGTDRQTYAVLKAQLQQQRFRLGITLGMIAQLADQIAAVAPGVDVSEPTIRAAWAQAEQVDL